MATTKTASHFDSALIDAVQLAAQTDETLNATLQHAIRAGAVLGASVHTSDATNEFKALGDQVALYATTILADADNADARAAFRLLCGVVNAAIKSAQVASKRAAIAKCEAAKLADYAKKARDRVVKCLDRHLALYEVKVNWQAVTVAKVEAAEPVSDAEKAAKAVHKAFQLDGNGAADGVCSLDLGTMAYLVERLQVAIIKARNDAMGADAKAKAAEAAEDAEAIAEDEARTA